ncbi:hypothetical protein ACLQ3K_25675 [Tsukamurella sp. DT100]|uniref:hypothetical protein n=1 Tax=Tsukamurella sp. DT100 TaxID=3393415 RepID=UPI003CEBF3FA
MIKTTTTYICDGCGYETNDPDADRATHASIHVKINTTRRESLMGIFGDEGFSRYVRRKDPVDAWVCGDCMNKVLAVIGQRFEQTP